MKLSKYEKIALSDKEVMEIIEGRANLILYRSLSNFNNIDEVLGPHQAAIILFESKPSFGHWVCLFKRGNVIEFFNPYGDNKYNEEGFPDETLTFISKKFRKQSNQDRPVLSQLLLDSPYQLTYNEYPFQEMVEDINTCGRHCAVRLMLRDLPLKEYYKFITYLCKYLDVDPDQLVTILTFYVNNI